jgi:uncharacterized membrane protein
VSADGSIIVGQGNSDAGAEAFRWTQAGGMVGLGDLAGGSFSSRANAVSADGAMVVGQGLSSLGNEAFVWDATRGMRSLRQVLIGDFGLGASLAGWTLTSANDISADGQFIVGSGTNPSGNPEAWIARLQLAPTLPGDFNQDGTVDAADYVVWRKTDGTQAGFDRWRAQFGENMGATGWASASAGALLATIPEPVSIALAAAGFVVWIACLRRRK